MSCRTITRFLLVCSMMFCAAVVAMATDPPASIFQLNGLAGSTSPSRPGSDNLSDPGPGFTCTYLVSGVATSGQPCDNWNLLNGNGSNGLPGHSSLHTFINPATLVFTKGTKDTQDVSVWNWAPHGSPGKDTFNAGYAAAYRGPTSGDLVVEFGADRATNNGDANIGIWFFQAPVTADAGGTFSCGQAGPPCHLTHDIFVTSAFVNGGGISGLNVYEWDTACSSITNTVSNPAVGACADTNLRLLVAPTAICGSSLECGVTNSATTHTSWEGGIASPQFFEGGVDVTGALAVAGVTTPPCFSAFEMETRASQSSGAELKAFILGKFPVCSAQISKSCFTAGSPNPSPFVELISGVAYIHYDFTGSVSNDGLGTIFDPTVTDTFPATAVNMKLNGTDCSSSCTVALSAPGGITGGNSVSYTGSFDFPTEGTIANNVTATAAEFEGGPQTVSKDHLGNSTAGSANFGETGTGCHITTHPVLTLAKFCNIRLEPTSGGVVLRQDDNIKVCNTSTDNTTTISNISIRNDVSNGGLSHSIVTGLTLAPTECQTYTPTYTPTDCDNNVVTAGRLNGTINPILDATGLTTTNPVAGRCEFSDAASISSVPKDEFGNSLSGSQIPNAQTAQCNLCLFGYCAASSVTH